MARGKKKHLDPPVEWKINIPTSVVAKVELLLMDPLTGRPRHGARSKLMASLLKEWLDKQQKKGGVI